MDIYQERYKAHIARKKAAIQHALDSTPKRKRKLPADHLALVDAIEKRRSQRIFNDLRLSKLEMEYLCEAVRLAPSSCNRQAISVKITDDAGDRFHLSSMLVGGQDWMFRATTVFLLFADMAAYKSPAEVDFMPWLDAGFVAQNICLMAEAFSLGACFVNPNIRPKDKSQFEELFNPRGLRFCGAVALGNYYERDAPAPKRPMHEIFYGGIE